MTELRHSLYMCFILSTLSPSKGQLIRAMGGLLNAMAAADNFLDPQEFVAKIQLYIAVLNVYEQDDAFVFFSN